MSPLWVLPVCVLAVGAVVVAVAARKLAAELAALRPALVELHGLRNDTRALGSEADAAWRRGATFVGVPDRFRAARAAIRLRRADR